MAFKKNGETKVFKRPLGGFTKKLAKVKKLMRYGIDDLVSDTDKGVDPYQSQADEDAEAEVIEETNAED